MQHDELRGSGQLSHSKIDTYLEDSGWVDVPLGSFTAISSTEKPQVRKIGQVVYLRGGIDNTGVSATTNYTGVMTIPADYRPSVALVVTIASSSAAASASGHVRDTGDVWLRTSGTVGSYYKWDGISWPLD